MIGQLKWVAKESGYYSICTEAAALLRSQADEIAALNGQYATLQTENYGLRNSIASSQAEVKRLMTELHQLTHEIESALAVSKTVADQGHVRPIHANLEEVLTDAVTTARAALHRISLCSQNSMSGKDECGRIAREALANMTDKLDALDLTMLIQSFEAMSKGEHSIRSRQLWAACVELRDLRAENAERKRK
jgi:ElaB/YqjD/DUF883 family membrane-anchored ribosome-binding protein